MKTPFFMTQHSPIGALASFTFGAIGKGVSIDFENPRVQDVRYDLYAGYCQAEKVMAMPFREGIQNQIAQIDAFAEGNKEVKQENKKRWHYFAEDEIRRTLTPCVDRFEAGRLTFEVFTPHFSLEDPEKGPVSDYAVCPGILLRLTIDNEDGEAPATGYLGLGHRTLRYLHTVQCRGLQGIGYKNRWMLLTDEQSDAFVLRSQKLDYLLQKDLSLLHQAGPGAICIKAQPGEKKTIYAAFGFYTADPATCGIETNYVYNQNLAGVYDVCRCILNHAEHIMEESYRLDDALAGAVGDADKLQIIAQGIRGYEASGQLTETEGKFFYNIGEGAYCWRNTLDLAADHLPWELYRNPWVVRNIMDMYIERYSYYDQVRFGDDPYELHEGGMSFTHDMGNYATFSPPFHSDYETDGLPNALCYLYMTTEELLNGIYCICAYALHTGDLGWLRKRSDVLRRLLISMENRDHYDPAKRDGILKAVSSRSLNNGRESTTYDALDHSLMDAAGNLYIAVKTGCALRLLKKCFGKLGDGVFFVRAQNMLQMNMESLHRFETKEGFLRANLYLDADSRLLAAIEPLAIPSMLGLADDELVPMKELLLKHIRKCMESGVCMDEHTGGIRLSSKSNNTWVSKVILCVAVMERVFHIDLNKDYPSVMRELLHWCQISAKDTTISDQIMVSDRTVIGGCYYPRSASSAIWLF